MKLSYTNVCAYLRSKGWRFLQLLDGVEIWTINFDDEQYHLSLPLNGSESQYCGDALSILAYTEDREIESIKKDIICL